MSCNTHDCHDAQTRPRRTHRIHPCRPIATYDYSDMLARAEPIIRSIVSKSIPRADREDILQEFRLAFWRSLPRYDESKSAWKTWAGNVARMLCRRYLSDRKRSGVGARLPFEEAMDATICDASDSVCDVGSPWADERDTDCPLFAELHAAIRRALIEPALQRLAPMSRDAVATVVLDGLSPDRVAVGLGRSVSCTKLMLRSAAKKLTLPDKSPQV